MVPLALALAGLLVPPALATKAILCREDVLSRPYASVAVDTTLTRRQDDGSDSEDQQTTLNPDGTLNMTTFSAATDEACRTALGKMARASSPSGMSICFNLPSLNTSDGVFEADLRLYRVSEPRDAWVAVNTSEIDVNVMFQNARVGSVTEENVSGVGQVGELGARDVEGKSELVARQDGGRRQQQQQQQQQPDLPVLMQSYMLVGQINQSKMSDNMTMNTLETLLMPSLGLTAPTPSRNLTTTLSPNEASFLTGVFSDNAPLSDYSIAKAAVDAQLRRLENATGTEPEVAFVLPGTQILIFPIGLVITGTWALLGIAAYGWGTVERMQFRSMYKERVGMAHSMGKRVGTGI